MSCICSALALVLMPVKGETLDRLANQVMLAPAELQYIDPQQVTLQYCHETDEWVPFVAILDGAPVGLVVLEIGATEVHIARLVVDRRVRRRGLATEMLNRVVQIVPLLAPTSPLAVTVDSLNVPALRLYQRFGFRQANVSLSNLVTLRYDSGFRDNRTCSQQDRERECRCNLWPLGSKEGRNGLLQND